MGKKIITSNTRSKSKPLLKTLSDFILKKRHSNRHQSAHLITGKHGEKIAANYLKKNGYKIVDRNYHCKFGEIDIIALNTGMRQDELLSLRWDKVNIFLRTAIIHESKNGNPRTLPLNKAGLEILIRKSKLRSINCDYMFANKVWTKLNRNNLYRSFKAALKKAETMKLFHYSGNCHLNKVLKTSVRQSISLIVILLATMIIKPSFVSAEKK